MTKPFEYALKNIIIIEHIRITNVCTCVQEKGTFLNMGFEHNIEYNLYVDNLVPSAVGVKIKRMHLTFQTGYSSRRNK